MPWPPGIPKNMTAEQRVERARHAAAVRASADGLIAALAKKTLTAEQRARLAEVLWASERVDR